MKEIILVVVMCLIFSTSGMAGNSTDILLTCWTDNSESKSLDNATTIILNPDNNTTEMIDPYNRLQTGNLTVAEYFYTITISKTILRSKIGEIKINRFTGRFSSSWQYPESEEGKFSKAKDVYGICVKLSNSVSRDF